LKLVLKYGGTSISSANDIQNVAKHIQSLSKQNQLVIVCSAISDTTDDLIEISQSIKKENKKKAEQALKEHEAVLEAIRARDAKKAEKMTMEHIEMSKDSIELENS